MYKSGIYIHVPFCHSKCIYCDFFSTRSDKADWDALVLALINELDCRIEEIGFNPDTLYIGGGTPSVMPQDSFLNLVCGVRELVKKEGDWSEFTIEVNPEDVDACKARIWKDAGVNRVSMGIQSLDDGELKAIRRNHDSSKAIESYHILRSMFRNVSVDLMFGLPGQTMESWISTVRRTLSLRPEHISAYSLMFEEKTPISILREAGKLSFPDEEECLSMWKILTNVLSENGYLQYEISNYAMPGYESIHNKRYWLGNPYLGIGPSAHSYDGKSVRRWNSANIKDYISFFNSSSDGISARGDVANTHFYEEECLDSVQLAEERIMLRLRMREGLDLSEFVSDFGEVALKILENNADSMIKEGKLVVDGGRLCLTPEGVMISDNVTVQLIT